MKEFDRKDIRHRRSYKSSFYRQYPEWGYDNSGEEKLPLIEEWLRAGDGKSEKFQKISEDLAMNNPDTANKLGLDGSQTQPEWNSFHWKRYYDWKNFKSKEQQMQNYASSVKMGEFQHINDHPNFGLSEQEIINNRKKDDHDVMLEKIEASKSNLMKNLIKRSQELY